MFVFHLSELLLLEICVISCLGQQLLSSLFQQKYGKDKYCLSVQDVLRNTTVTSQMLTKHLEILKAGILYDGGNLSKLP